MCCSRALLGFREEHFFQTDAAAAADPAIDIPEES